MTQHDPNRDVHSDVDAWLHTLDDPQPSAQLRRAVAEVPVRHPRAEGWSAWWPFGSVWKGLVAATVACALGVIVGAASIDDGALNAETATVNDTWSASDADLAFALTLDEELTP